MKIKKLLLIPIIALPFTLSGCGEKYYLSVECQSDFVKSLTKDVPKSGYYRSGKKFTFKVEMLCDADVYVYQNNKSFSDVQYEGNYAIYSFTMPKENTTLAITMDDFYLDKEYRITQLYFVPWHNPPIFTVDELSRIELTTYIDGISPEIKNPVKYVSEDIRDFEYNLNVIKNKTVTKAKTMENSGGTSRSTYKFYYDYAEGFEPHYLEITILNGKYIEYYNGYFEIKDEENFKLSYARVVED